MSDELEQERELHGLRGPGLRTARCGARTWRLAGYVQAVGHRPLVADSETREGALRGLRGAIALDDLE
jgi:hypothetical protein